jgi:hypothetical protein
MGLLSGIPVTVFDGAFARGSPMKDGSNGLNQNGWMSVGYQRGAMLPIMYAAVRGDATIMAEYWPVLDVSFAHQQTDGSFEYAPTIEGIKQEAYAQPTADSFWIAESAEALLLVRQSSLAARYAGRIDDLLPKYRTSLLWLSQPEQISDLIKADSVDTNRLFEDSKALLLGDKLSGVPQAKGAGEKLLGMALAAQRPDGVFPENGGDDTNYQSVSCLKLAEMALFITDPRLGAALATGAQWELSRIHDDGEVDVANNTRTGGAHKTPAGLAYGVNYPEVIRMFALAGALLDEPRFTDAAVSVAAYLRQHRHG